MVGRPHDGRRRRAGELPASRRPAAPPDRGARPAQRLEPAPQGRCGWPPALACGTRTRTATCCPAPPPRADTPGGAGDDAGAARVLQRRLPHRRADPRADGQRGGDRQRRLVARPRAGRRARGGRHLGRSSRTSSFRKLARRVRDNSGVPKTGPMDRIHAAASSCRRAPTSASAASPATPRPAPASTRAGSSRTRSTSRRSRCRSAGTA